MAFLTINHYYHHERLPIRTRLPFMYQSVSDAKAAAVLPIGYMVMIASL